MRLAIITATPASVQGGSGTYVAAEQLGAELARQGHTVRMIRPEASRLPTFTLRRFAFNRALIEPADVDGIVGFDMDGYRLAGRTRAPFVTYVHGCIADEMRFERGRIAWALALQARAERRSVLHARLVLATSEYSRRRIAELYRTEVERIAVVPPPLDVVGWQHEIAEARVPASDHPVVLAVAHWYPRKNLFALVRAFARLGSHVPDAELRVVGLGPTWEQARHMARFIDLGRRMTFLGHVTRQQLAMEYAGCDVFCLPSRQEGFGLVYVEAMAAGKPVVALASARSPGELLTHGENGLLTADDSDQIADALRLLLADPRLRARMGEANRKAALQWDKGVSVARFVAVLEELRREGQRR
ncbi:MAG TPA: glycosyltransferase family 4 protein [Gemmatimonadales bacterium]|jgi:glycosyltransferase involved in cell wall biosynthesis